MKINKMFKRIILLVLILFVALLVYKILFRIKNSPENYEWQDSRIIYDSYSRTSHEIIAYRKNSAGYRIYANGTIHQYYEDEILKTNKISNDELNELKRLVCLIRDIRKQYKIDDEVYEHEVYSQGIIVYSPRLEEEITLCFSSATSGYANKTKESQEIQKLAQSLYDKYLKD